MFRKKKDVAERSRSLVKKKELKKLKADLLKAFPLATEDLLDELLPPKEGVEMVKVGCCLQEPGLGIFWIWANPPGPVRVLLTRSCRPKRRCICSNLQGSRCSSMRMAAALGSRPSIAWCAPLDF